MLYKPVKYLIGTVFILVTLSGCTTTIGRQSKIDAIHKALISQNCTLPCWRKIQVGSTNFNDARNILQEQYGSDKLIIGKYDLTWHQENENIDGVKEGIISFSNNVTAEILLSFDNNANFRVGDLIGFIGEPISVGVSWGGPIKPSTTCLGTSLLYPNKGIIVLLDTRNEFKGVNANQLISILRLLPINGNTLAMYDIKIIAWKGYQDYCRLAINDP